MKSKAFYFGSAWITQIVLMFNDLSLLTISLERNWWVFLILPCRQQRPSKILHIQHMDIHWSRKSVVFSAAVASEAVDEVSDRYRGMVNASWTWRVNRRMSFAEPCQQVVASSLFKACAIVYQTDKFLHVFTCFLLSARFTRRFIIKTLFGRSQGVCNKFNWFARYRESNLFTQKLLCLFLSHLLFIFI